MKARPGMLRPLVCLLTAFALSSCIVIPGSVSASGYKLKGTFGASAQPSFLEPMPLAVDPASGDLLVVDVEAQTISRFKPDGTPDNFSALSGNVIDGKSGPDDTPQHGLEFEANPRTAQVAVDASCALHDPPLTELTTPTCAEFDPANGDIYITQGADHLIDIFDSSGEYLDQLSEFKEGTGASGPLKPLNLTTGVAVDPTGAIYVSAFDGGLAGEIHKYAPVTSDPLANTDNVANFSRPSFGHVAAGSGPTAGSIFSAGFIAEAVKLNAATGIQQCQITPEETVALTANPVDGRFFNATELEVREYEGSCASSPEKPVRSFTPPAAGGHLAGFAVDGTREVVYVSRESLSTIEVWEVVKVPEAKTLPASPVEVTGATLRGEVNPNSLPLTGCAFEWGETTAYGHVAPCEAPDAAEVGEGASFVPVHAAISDLEAGTAYHFQLVAANVNNAPGEVIEGGDQELRTAGPQVRGGVASEVTATTARVGATVDPNGQETSFFIEYLSDAAFQANPESERFAGAVRAPLGERKVPVAVSGSGNVASGSSIVTGVIVSSGAFGPGETISGPGIPTGTTILSLPTPTRLQLSKAATATTAVAALTATGPQPVAQLLTELAPQTVYHFRMVASNGVATVTGAARELTTFPSPAGSGACANEALRAGLSATLPDCRAYEMVSPPLKAGEVIPPEPTAELGGSCGECLPGINKRPLPMQSAPDGNSVLYTGQAFGANLAAGPNEYLSGRSAAGWSLQSVSPPSITGLWEAFSTDLSRGVLAQSEPPLAPEAPSRAGQGFANLYLRGVGGALEPLVTTEPPHRGPGATSLERFQVRYAGANSGMGSGPFSHVVFEANDALTAAAVGIAPAAPQLNEFGSECTVSPCDLYQWAGGKVGLVNVLPGNTEAAGEAVVGAGRLLGGDPVVESPNVNHAISADGRRVFWSSGETGHVYVRVDGTRTFEVEGPSTCEESIPASLRACFLTASADGSRVLLSNGMVYALNEDAEAYEEAVDLSEGEGGFRGILGASTDLSRIYFVDTEALTPPSETNANPAGPEHAEEGAFNLYAWRVGASTSFIGALLGSDGEFGVGGRYGAWHASTADRTAQVSADGERLAFMSRARLTGYDNTRAGGGACNQGAAACFEVFEYAADSGTLTCASCNPSGQRPLGRSNLILLKPGAGSPEFPQPGNLSTAGGGRLFFESQDALVPQDTNGSIQDVYEWEPNDVGDCLKAGGCLRLISSGQAANDSMFVDSSASGDDVFFITRQRLLPRDQDSQLDLYDVRVGGGIAEEAAVTCGGEACRGPIPEPSSELGGGSQSFSGPGNPKPKPGCRSGYVRKQGKCVKKKQRSKKHKRTAGHNRGGAK